jgi:ketosteroid isomerase-like protein
MSLQKNQRPIYQRPRHPSDQLSVVFDYLDYLKRWDIDALDKLFTSDFTQQTFPESLGIPSRNRREYLECLPTLRDSLNGVPLEVRDTQICFDLISAS